MEQMSSQDNISSNLLFLPVREYVAVDEQLFTEKILSSDQPALLKNCDFGDCLKLWNLSYLKTKLGHQPIVIHKSPSTDLDFLSKNFKYEKCLFSDFCRELETTGTNNIYLRSTNSNPRSNKQAKIEEDFSCIASDLKPPSFIPYHSNQLYQSSVLRIASQNVQIWTHFDLYHNVLVQTVGTKRVILIPPEDTRYLYIQNDKSPVNNFDDIESCVRDYPLISKASIQQVILRPTDALFIPALWWHNIRTVSNDSHTSGHTNKNYSIGFNIFWKDKSLVVDGESSFYASTDVYGNKHLVPFDAALANMNKAIAHLNRLPGKYNQFHKFMILANLKAKLFPGQNLYL